LDQDRHYKDGVNYWNLDVDFFENKKVRLIISEFGIKGAYILLVLFNEIYRTCGYYKKWDRDDCLLMAGSSAIAGNCSPAFIAEVVIGLVRRSLLDQGVLDRFGVLTSAEIQRRFLRMVGNSRESIPIVQEYFLLDLSGGKDVTRATRRKLTFFSISSKDNAENLKVTSQNLTGFDKEKKRKGKQSKEDDCACGHEPVVYTPAVAFYRDRVAGPVASPRVLGELRSMEEDLGSEVCIRAMMLALEQGKPKWNFILGILKNKQRDGIRSLAAWDAHEAERDERKRRQYGNEQLNGTNGSVAEEYGVKPDYDL